VVLHQVVFLVQLLKVVVMVEVVVAVVVLVVVVQADIMEMVLSVEALPLVPVPVAARQMAALLVFQHLEESEHLVVLPMMVH
jgi:hypothetical protein